jgi:hypothetical protein
MKWENYLYWTGSSTCYKREFIEILGLFGVSVFNYPIGDIDKAIRDVGLGNC